jgi:hypothetical protein
MGTKAGKSISNPPEEDNKDEEEPVYKVEVPANR